MNPRRFLFFLALALAVGSVVGLGFRFLIIPHWRAVLLILYFAFGLFGLATNIYVSRKQQTESDKIKRKILQSYIEANPRFSTLARLRHTAGIIVGMLVEVILWPSDIFNVPNFKFLISQAASGGDWPSLRLLGLESELRRKEYLSSFFTFLVIGATFWLGFAGVTIYGAWLIFFYVCASSIALRHLRYILSIEGLPAQLRRTRGNPYVTFLGIALLDFASLSLASTVLLSGYPTPNTLIPALENAAESIFVFAQVKGVIAGLHLSARQIVVGIAGVFFNGALLRSVLEFRRFRRNDSDYHWLAGRHNVLGRFADALTYVEKVENPVLDTHSSRAIALLGVNQIEKARNSARLMLATAEHSIEPDPDDVWSLLSLWTGYFPISSDNVLHLYEAAIGALSSDVLLHTLVASYVQDHPEVISKLKAIVTPHSVSYPLTWVVLHIASEETNEAYAILNGLAPQTQIEKLAVAELKFDMATADDTMTADEEDRWLEEIFAIFTIFQTSQSKPWELRLAYYYAVRLQAGLAEVKHARLQEAIYLANGLRSRVSALPYGGEITAKVVEKLGQLSS